MVTDATKVPFDRFLAGDDAAMSDAAKRGLELFNGKAGCISCHNGALGVRPAILQHRRADCAGVCRRSALSDHATLGALPEGRVGRRLSPHRHDDLGLYFQTKRPDDKRKFRTPSLRELRWTEPYMHNGTLETLADVVAFYDAGGGEGQTAGLEPLGLSAEDQADLVAFLEALSMDEPLLMDEPELPETATWAEFSK